MINHSFFKTGGIMINGKTDEEIKNQMGGKTLQDVYQLCCEVMGIENVTPIIKNHVSSLILEDHFTALEIMRCIVYADEIEHLTFKPQFGIRGTLLNIREASAKYFYNLEKLKEKQVKEANDFLKFQDNKIIINISKIPHKKRQQKKLDVSEIQVEEEDNHHDN